MNLKPLLNQRYAELCKDLGHLQSNMDILAEKIGRVKAEIRALNDFSSSLPKVDNMLSKVESKDDSGQLK